MEAKKYSIDIETPEGKLISDATSTSKSHGAIDVELPEGYAINDAGEVVVEAAAPVVEPVSEAKKKKDHMGMKAKNTIANTVIYVILSVMTVIWLLPFLFILLESLRVETTAQVGYIIPHKWGFDNYVRLFSKSDFGKWMLNTSIIGVVTSILQTLFVLSVSYALSRTRFKGRKALMNFMLILGMFPGFLTLLLLYKFLTVNPDNPWFTNGNAMFGLIIVYVASSGMGYYVSKGFFDTIPKSLDEAARIDGATQLQVFYKVILPMAKPIVIYTILMGFMAPWGDFVMASYMANNTSAGYNVAVGLQSMISTSNISNTYTTFCAGGVVVAIPITALFLFLQKYYVEGVTGGAVKG